MMKKCLMVDMMNKCSLFITSHARRSSSMSESNELDRILANIAQPRPKFDDDEQNTPNNNREEDRFMEQNQFIKLAARTSFQYIPLADVPSMGMLEFTGNFYIFPL